MVRWAMCTGLFVLVLGIAGCSNYGTKMEVNGSDLFYTDNVTKEEATKLGDFLKEIGYFKDGNKIAVQLDRDGDTYVMRFVVVDDYKDKEPYPGVFQFMGASASYSVFDGKPVAVHLTDGKLKTRETIEPEDVGKILKADKITLHYTKRVKKEDAEKTLAYLKNSQKNEEKKPEQLFQLDSENNVFIVRIRVRGDYKKLPEYPGGPQVLAARVSHHALGDRPVETHLATLGWKTREKLPGSAVGRIVEIDNIELLYTDGVTSSQAKQAGEILKQGRAFRSGRVTVQLRAANKGYELRFVVTTGFQPDAVQLAFYRGYGMKLSRDVFGGKPVEVHLTDRHLRTTTKL